MSRLPTIIYAYLVIKAAAEMEGVSVNTKVKHIEKHIKQFDIDISEDLNKIKHMYIEAIADALCPESNVGKGLPS